MKTRKAYNQWNASPHETRYWAICLAFLLILAQAALLQHIAVHELQDAISPDNDHCTFCAVGAHADAAVAPEPILLFTWVAAEFIDTDTSIVGLFSPTACARGPPSSIA